MGARKVVVKGGGANLYKVSESGGTFYVYHVRVGIFTDSTNDIGKTRSLEDALTLIKVHSGQEIAEIDSW